MSSNNVVKKYAKSLFDVTYEKGSAGEVGQQLNEITKIFSSEVVAFFTSPFNAADNKLTAAKAALEGKVTAETFNFILVLVQNERVALLKDIAKEFSSLVQASAGITKGKLSAAQEVSSEFLKQAEETASKALGKKVELTFEKNPSLVAGFKVEVAGWTMDDSAQAHLKSLKDDLIKRGL
ncbi:ATP synthase F1 subunit delta [Bdellovibrio sp. qaytius]|nr:ATP synthase F1 subunit delta [Bdellovibrio sp. qaytius]